MAANTPIENQHNWENFAKIGILHCITAIKMSKGGPITRKGRRGITGFYANHFLMCRAVDGGAYLLSVPALPSPPRKDGCHQLRLWLTIGCPGNRNRLPRVRVQRLDHYTNWRHHNGLKILFICIPKKRRKTDERHLKLRPAK